MTVGAPAVPSLASEGAEMEPGGALHGLGDREDTEYRGLQFLTRGNLPHTPSVLKVAVRRPDTRCKNSDGKRLSTPVDIAERLLVRQLFGGAALDLLRVPRFQFLSREAELRALFVPLSRVVLLDCRNVRHPRRRVGKR